MLGWRAEGFDVTSKRRADFFQSVVGVHADAKAHAQHALLARYDNVIRAPAPPLFGRGQACRLDPDAKDAEILPHAAQLRRA